jgi:hypothetical protein
MPGWPSAYLPGRVGPNLQRLYDLVCFFDCLHDMGDPLGACAHARDHLARQRAVIIGRSPTTTSPATRPGQRRLLQLLDPALHAEFLSQEVGTALGAGR